jgi:O-antigen/teichoic acid export membrane protein
LLPGRPLRAEFSSLTAANVAVAATSFVTTLALARTLGPREFGQIVFAQTLAQVIFVLCDPRLEDTLMRFVPILEQSAERGQPTAFVRRLLTIDAGIALLAAVFFGCLVAGSGADPGAAYRSDLLLLALAQMAALAPYGTVGAAFGITNGWARFGVLDVGRVAFTTVAALIALASAGAEAYLAVTAVCSLLSTCVIGAVALKRLRRLYGSAERVHPLPLGIVGFTLKSSAASSLTTGTEQLPLVILGAVAGPTALGVFRVALSPARLVTAAVSPVSAILFPRFSRNAAQLRPEAVRSAAFGWTKFAFPVAALGTVLAAFILSDLIVWAFGEEFAAASDAALLLLAAALLRSCVAWSKVLAPAVGRPGFRATVIGLEAILLSVATYALAPSGIDAVAGAYLGVAALTTAIWLGSVRPLTTAARLAQAAS